MRILCTHFVQPILYFLVAIFFVLSCELLCDLGWLLKEIRAVGAFRVFGADSALFFSKSRDCSVQAVTQYWIPLLTWGIIIGMWWSMIPWLWLFAELTSFVNRTMKILFLWYVMPGIQKYRCQSVGGTFCFHCQVDVGRGDSRTCVRHVEWPAIEQGFLILGDDWMLFPGLGGWYLWALCIRVPVCRLSGVENLRLLSRCLENLCAPVS